MKQHVGFKYIYCTTKITCLNIHNWKNCLTNENTLCAITFLKCKISKSKHLAISKQISGRQITFGWESETYSWRYDFICDKWCTKLVFNRLRMRDVSQRWTTSWKKAALWWSLLNYNNKLIVGYEITNCMFLNCEILFLCTIFLLS